MTVLIIEDLVWRKWITHARLRREGPTSRSVSPPGRPWRPKTYSPPRWSALRLSSAGWSWTATMTRSLLLLAVSDNGSQMIAASTRRFMAMVAIAQHFGRSATPTDQAWIESRGGTLKAQWPHLLAITNPAVLRAELDSVRDEYNSQPLHPGYRLHPLLSTSTRDAGQPSAEPARTAWNEPLGNDRGASCQGGREVSSVPHVGVPA